MKGTCFFITILINFFVGCDQDKAVLIFDDDFNKLDTNLWIAEIEPVPGSSVYVKESNLYLDTKGGVTLWLNKNLSGNIRIEYSRRVLSERKTNDRVSDLNTFWMATDPRNKNLFTRNGVFESYDSLLLYYVGLGGNGNTTTRFRKYEGNGSRTLLKEWLDDTHLLKPYFTYTIRIEVRDKTTSFSVNDKPWFEYKDSSLLKEGYFGFRCTHSRQAIDWIRIYQLE